MVHINPGPLDLIKVKALQYGGKQVPITRKTQIEIRDLDPISVLTLTWVHAQVHRMDPKWNLGQVKVQEFQTFGHDYPSPQEYIMYIYVCQV